MLILALSIGLFIGLCIGFCLGDTFGYRRGVRDEARRPLSSTMLTDITPGYETFTIPADSIKAGDVIHITLTSGD